MITESQSINTELISIDHHLYTNAGKVKMHTYNNRMGSIVSRKLKSGMMHILEFAQRSIKSKKVASSKKSLSLSGQDGCESQTSVHSKHPLTRKLTQDEITEAELALKRLQAEKKRLEDLLNGASDKHLLHSTYSNEDVTNNNNVRKELVKIPRYQQKVAFMLHNVFTEEECDQLLKELENNAESTTKSEEIVSSTTHSEAMSKRLWPVLQNEVPKTWMGNTLLGLSNRCILERQRDGYSHKPGMDEAYEPIEGKEKSFFSVYVFLNDDFEGGQSSFLKNWQPSSQDVQVQPKKGSVFVHQHNLLHEVKPVTQGEKKVVRFDVMYNTSKRDLLAEMYG